jgi:DNA-directed RNA polymerase sigma subunit (sigma70/sigma32)
MPSTFFFPYIKHEMQGFITRNVDKTTSHYSSNIKKINKAIELFEEKGIQYTNVDIAIQTGMTIETVDQSLAIRNYRDEVHIDACPPNVIDAELEHSRMKTPEQEIMENEEREAVYRTMNTLLTEEEIAVLEYRFGLNDVQIISEGEIAKKLQIPKDKVKRILNRAMRKLRQSELANLYNDSIKQEEHFLDDVQVSFIPREATQSDIEFLSQIDSICDDY